MNTIDIGTIFENSKFKADEVSYLNHYTSLCSLETILKNKSFMFNRIDKVNDLIEHSRIDIFDDRKVFVSCFTKRQNESYFFWKSYSHKQEGRIGIRISFPPEVAALNEFFFDSECTRTIPFVDRTEFNYDSYSEEQDWGIRLFGTFNVHYLTNLNDLTYEDSNLKEFLEGCVTTCRLPSRKHHLPGIVKTVEWDSEEEVRTVVFMRPKGPETILARPSDGDVDKNPQPSFDSLFLSLPTYLLEKCIFTVSPLNTDNYNHVVETINGLVHVPAENIRRSVLSINPEN